MFDKKDNASLNKMQPKTTFIFGLVLGILVVCAVGFFILLATVIKDKDQTANKNTNNNPVADQVVADQAEPTNLALNLKILLKMIILWVMPMLVLSWLSSQILDVAIADFYSQPCIS